MQIEIRKEPFEPYAEVEAFERTVQMPGKFGATATFTGTMRDFNEGKAVSKMVLEYYPGMTEKHLQDICRIAREKWDVTDILLLHRVGEIAIGDPIVLVAVWSAHRAPAFDACRYIMEDLKSRAPFWKQETRADGERWVEKNTPG